ncbi:MAG TPA: MOSC domain-containing protein [Candidatus Dormibacteraeota bacterium]|jgi:MOSC domain-containing protein YiiM
MQPVPSATLTTGVGLDGDKHASAASKRQVLIADREALDALDLRPGTIKENLTVEGLDAMSLTPGTRIRLGATAMLEITSVCEPCFRMDEIRQGLKTDLEGRRGMNSVVIAGGPIRVGDLITTVEPRAV